MKQLKVFFTIFAKRKFMRNIDTFRQYIWLVSTIQRLRRISYGDIKRLWKDNDMNEGKPLSRTTFYRLRQSIRDMFGVCIESDNQHQYFISNPEALCDNSTQNWMLRTLTVNSILLDGLSIKDQLLLEDIPSGLEHLETIINAIKVHHTLRMSYKKFTDSKPYSTIIEPYCLKLFHQRWYLLGKSEKRGGNLSVFSLDRMTELSETEQEFILDPDFDAETFFKNYFGVIPDQKVQVERIVLRAYSPMDDYLRTLPLHHSQQEIATEKECALFEYQLAPTRDFIQAILKEGQELEVIEPESLWKKIRKELTATLKRYNRNTSNN